MTELKNYTLLEEKYLKEEKSNALVFEHNVTKAKVFVLKNDDDNKLFSIGFRTPPFDSSGVCHILEHCVLNGSKKYKTKEPFMDMIKSSLQTFLNAMTYSDKTLYPVASRNKKDFENLFDLYLDAVFNPIVLEKKEIFLQEGWRHEIDDKGNISYKGVVYNEMKGAMSSSESQVYYQIYKNLLPDTIYSYISGGDPYQIPNLSYEDFVNYHKNYYHPSNSYIFLYGDVDYEEYLNYIHEEYLKDYQYKKVDSMPQIQKLFTQKKFVTEEFSTNKEVEDNSNMVSYSIVTSTSDSNYDRIMNQLLRNVLISSESSPLKEAINKLDIVEDILSSSADNRQITFSIIGKNIREKDVDLFVDTLENSLRDLSEHGINQDLIRSMLNNLSFSLKEKDENPTKGIEYLDRAFDTWLYDNSPIEGIDLKETLEYIKDNIDKGIFERYIRENLLSNPHKLVIFHKAVFGLNEEKDKRIEKDLEDLAKSLSQEEKQALLDQREKMEIFQNREDTPEEKATIPTLDLSDVNTKFTPIDRKLEELDGVKVITHDLATSGIDYLNLVFNINHLSKEELPYLTVLADVLGLLDTKNYDYKDLFTKIYLETGGIFFNIGSHIVKDTDKFNRTLSVSMKVFSNNIEKAFEVLEEIMFNTKFESEKRLKELVNMIKSRSEMALLGGAHALMMSRAKASKFIEYDFMEKVSGLDSYIFYKNLKDQDLADLLVKLKDVYAKVFNKNGLIINVTSDFTNKDSMFSSMKALIGRLDESDLVEVSYDFKPQVKKEAFIASTDVSYVSLANDLSAYGYKYKGSGTVVAGFLSTGFLYGEIRAKSGAYGAGMQITNKDAFTTFSYRDPNISKTIDTYRAIPEYLESLDLSEEDLKSIIIGAVGRFDPPMTEQAKGRRDLDMYLTGRDYSELEEYVKEALATNLEDFRKLSPLIKDALKDASLAVLTSQTKYETEKDQFDQVIKLI